MFKEFDRIVLTKDLPDSHLVKGDIGTIVHIYENGRGYEVEFMLLNGETVSVETLTNDHVRPIHPKEIANARAV
ncbi:DUF4926 domain-containing protein [bacterium]|nr:DUF4926 domain-containing protein [bacterium]